METSDIDWEQHEKNYTAWLESQGIDDDLWWLQFDLKLDIDSVGIMESFGE